MSVCQLNSDRDIKGLILALRMVNGNCMPVWTSTLKMIKQALGWISVVECLPSMWEALGSIFKDKNKINLKTHTHTQNVSDSISPCRKVLGGHLVVGKVAPQTEVLGKYMSLADLVMCGYLGRQSSFYQIKMFSTRLLYKHVVFGAQCLLPSVQKAEPYDPWAWFASTVTVRAAGWEPQRFKPWEVQAESMGIIVTKTWLPQGTCDKQECSR